jgi:hypothetical protein
MPLVMRFHVASPTVRRVSPRYGPLFAQVRSPLPDPVAREGHQVKDLGVPVRGERQVVFYPHQRGRQGVVADNLRGQLLRRVGYRGAVVSGQLGADNDRGVPLIVGEVDAHPAPAASWGRVDVVGH